MNEAKLLYQNCGSHWAVGIQCDDDTLREQTFNSFWNHGATSTEPHILTDTLWYFWTTPAKLKQALINAEWHKFLNEHPEADETHEDAMPHAIAMATLRLNEMESDNFFSPRSKNVKNGNVNDYYSLGTICAENLSDSDA